MPPATRLGATELKRTYRPSGLIEGRKLSLRPTPNATGLAILDSLDPGLNGAFTVMHFPGQDHRPIAFSEGAAGDLFVENEPEVARYSVAFNHLRAAALSPVESASKIAKIRDQL